jgi:hypothetical protein
VVGARDKGCITRRDLQEQVHGVEELAVITFKYLEPVSEGGGLEHFALLSALRVRLNENRMVLGGGKVVPELGEAVDELHGVEEGASGGLVD